MKAICRSVLGALVFVKCGFLGSLSVAAYKIRACAVETWQCALQKPFVYFNTFTHSCVQAPQCSRNCNHRRRTDAGLGCYCFPYRPEQHIYFSCVLSSLFMAEKTIRWVKSAASLAFCLFAVLKAE